MLLLGIIACSLGLSRAAAYNFFQHDLQTITVTDFTAAGKTHRQPSTAGPVYYAAVSAGYYDFGASKGGEKPIARRVVDQTVLKVLAKQGYLPSTAEHPPEIVLAWKWGTMNVDWFPVIPGVLSVRANERQLLRFLGGEKLGILAKRADPFIEQNLLPGLRFQTGDARNLADTAQDDLYVIAIAAYDVKLAANGRGLLLWNTRISAPSRGFWLPEALPAMLAIATPYIGRETDKPVWIRATDKFKPNIQLGDTKMVEFLEGAEASVAKVGPSR